MSAPERPELPPDTPAEMRDFLECRRDVLVVSDGVVDWLPMPAAVAALGSVVRPKAAVTQGDRAGRARLVVGWRLLIKTVGATLQLEVVEGRLVVATLDLPSLLGDLDGGIRSWVDDVNGWLAANGRQLAPIEVRPGAATLRKIER